PLSFQSREFLRQLLVGRIVQFSVLYTVPTSNREYGIVVLPNSPGPKTLPELCVAEGWVRLREDASRREPANDETAAYLDKLAALESQAKAAGKGVWGPHPAADAEPHCAYEVADPLALLRQLRPDPDHAARSPVPAIVEKVLAGDRLIVRLLLSPREHVQTLVLLAGLRAPSTRRTLPDGSEAAPAEPFGPQAQQFVEARLLQRRVAVAALALSPQNTLIASVAHPNGDIALLLLQNGLARCNDHHVTLLGRDMAALRAAEAGAKAARKGMFVNLVGSPAVAGGAASVEAEYVVARVMRSEARRAAGPQHERPRR
ncbi:hypothetical protein KEM52_004319, partial [Ascosphaera acerosa]